MLYAVFDCVSTVNGVIVYLINHAFACAWACAQANSYSTGLSPVALHEDILYVDAQIDRSSLYAAFDCVSYMLTLRLTDRCCAERLIVRLLSMTRMHA